MHPQSHLHLLVLLPLTVTSGISTAQSPPPQNNGHTFPKANVSPSVSILIISVISAFVFLAFFYVYFRQYMAMNSTSTSIVVPTRARSIIRHGLNPEILSTFPTLIYSEVKEHNLSKSVLECAVCLNEFEDSETLRLLPNCSHAFHTNCIDVWLAAHITCPVCRCNLTEPVKNKESEVVIEVEVEDEDDEERRREMDELEQYVSVRRERHFRSYTTGNAGMLQRVEDIERYTLRLPEDVKNAIMLKRTSSCVVFRHEESEKRGFRTTEKLGSLLKRAISMKNVRVLRWDSGKSEGSVRSNSFRHVISRFDCYPGSSFDFDKLDKVEKLSGAESSRQKD